MRNMEKALLKDLECSICFRYFRNAKFLKCLHSFCDECVDTLLRNEYQKRGVPNDRGLDVACPMCRQKTSFSKCSTDDLKPNTIANSVVQTVKTHRNKSKRKECPQRHSVAAAEKDLNSLKVFCEKCKVSVDCAKPEFLEHFDHVTSMHPLQDASKRVTTQMNILLERSATWTEEHLTYQEMLEQMKRQGKRCFGRLEDDVDRAYEVQSQKLRDAKEKLRADIAERKASFCAKFDRLLEQDRYWTASMVEAQRVGNDHLIKNNAEKTLPAFEMWQMNMKETLSVEVPSKDDARREANVAMSLCLEQKLDDVHLGTLKQMAGIKINQTK